MIIEPLVDALASGEAVAFVGSGASISSGLPDWRTFLLDLLAYAECLHIRGIETGRGGWRRTRELLEGGDFLQAAEMLQRELPSRVFTSYIDSVFGKGGEPNDIHLAIARLPFSLILTTNFDLLLEAAYDRAPSFTWRDTDGVFNAIRSKKFAIIKLHGSANDPESIRLTRTHYRDSTFGNPEFNECLKSLLTWKTMLFIGYSLRDSDLLHLVDEARLRFGKKFGPHYAIMPAQEVDDKFRAYLKDAFAIEVLEYTIATEHRDEATARVASILRDLSGQVARVQLQTAGQIRSESSATRAQAAQLILETAVRITGSSRGDVCFMADDANPQIRRVASHPPLKGGRSLPEIAHDSVIGTAFLQANADISKDYIYIRDVADAKTELRSNGWADTEYVPCDGSVRTELAYPIIADGRRVGTLNLEANVVDAYTSDHRYVARRLVEELGRVYIQSERRRMRSVPLASFYREPSRFEALLNKSRLIRALGHDFILYEIDHEAKQLVAHHVNNMEPFCYGFDSKSLAVQVFMERHEIHVDDAQHELTLPPEMRTSWLSPLGVERFRITGPVFACPVRLGGQTEAILVTWLNPDSRRLPEDVTTPLCQLFQSSCRQVLRLSSFIANDRLGTDRLRAEEFLEKFYNRLGQIDHGKVWSRSDLKDAEFRGGILTALLEGLLVEETGLKRVRVWKTLTPIADERDGGTKRVMSFQCVRSLTSDDATLPGKLKSDAYVGCKSDATDTYCRYTINRYRHDPFARWQHPAMFGRTDPNCTDLDKDPAGSWIVAPIVRGEKLLGFLSADNHIHCTQPKKDGEPDFREIAQQCRIMNIVADLSQYVLPSEGKRFRE
ncbi:MAG TPA: SIR2 family protein [Candidatus Limnocylindrales bacterium]|nr:SIR2 family protein [Candidatus Limnocylindrales bacterium]